MLVPSCRGLYHRQCRLRTACGESVDQGAFRTGWMYRPAAGSRAMIRLHKSERHEALDRGPRRRDSPGGELARCTGADWRVAETAGPPGDAAHHDVAEGDAA